MRVSCVKLIRALTRGGCRLLRNSHVRLPAGKAEGAIESNSHFETKFEMTRENLYWDTGEAVELPGLSTEEIEEFDGLCQRIYDRTPGKGLKTKPSSP